MLGFLMLLCGVSGHSVFDSSFHFVTQPHIFHRSEEVCNVCYGHFDCLEISKAECDYKAEADVVLNDPEEEVIITNESIKSDVDTMMYDLMLKESVHVHYRECIPLISSYTDCHKDNICTGCTKCECSPEGQWNCSWLQDSRQEHVSVNHRVLALAMENLREATDPPNRHKRSEETAEDQEEDHITPEALSEWMYGGELKITHGTRNPRELKENNVTKEIPKEIKTTTEAVNKPTEEIIRNLAFDEVLREIGLDFKTNVSAYNTTSERNNASINTKKFLEMLAIEEGKDATKPSTNDTKVIVDLLNDDVNFSVDTGNFIISDPTEKNKDVYSDLNTDIDAMGYTNFVNVKKRSVGLSSIVKTGNTTKRGSVTTVTAVSNKTSNVTTLQNQIKVKVLNQINKITEDKYKEIQLLNNLKDSLINFISVCNATVDNDSGIYYNRSSLTNKSSDNVEINNYFRRNVVNDNTAMLNRYMIKIKRDLKEVIQDIFGLRKFQGRLSKDLKLVLHAISNYMKNNNLKIRDNKRRYKTRHYNSRRQLEFDDFNVNYIKGALLNMLQVLDRDMPLANALGPLSPGAKKILKRVISNNYVDDSTVVGFRINDPKYNMVTDLKDMGVVKWHKLIENIANGSSVDRLYNIRLLYFTLSRDIIKLREAFALIKFSSIHRMARIDENLGNEIVRSIDTNLNTLSYEINRFINRSKENKPVKKKMSLLKKIKKLLSLSKNSMLNILRNKKQNNVAENNIKKTEQKKQLSLWMEKIQKNPSKKKRSLSDYEYAKGIPKQRNRMKNIIPQYLRGKINPALTKGKGLRRKIYSKVVKPKNQKPVNLKPKMMTSTAKPKHTKSKAIEDNAGVK